MAFLGQYFCVPPCERSFATPKSLSLHRSHSAACRKRWNNYLAQDARDMAIEDDIDNHEAADVDALDNLMGHDGDENNAGEREGRPDELEPNFEDPPMPQYPDNDYDDPPPFEYGDEDGNEGNRDLGEADLPALGAPPAAAQERDYADLRPAMDDTGEDSMVELYEGAAWVIGRGDAPFSILLRNQLSIGLNNVFYPFAGAKEWELACWMHNSSLSRRQMDNFLRLNYINTIPLSFRTGDALIERLEALPSAGTTWMAHDIDPGSGTLLDPVTLFFRDPMKAIESLLQRPTFKDSLDFVPRKVWSDPQDPDDPDRRERNYKEIFSGEWAWRTQTTLPPGAALIPVILASDSTSLTVFSGNKEAWPLYLSIGNIRSDIRNKPSNGAWVLIAYIPDAKWADPSDHHSTLKHRLFHQCLTHVFESLIQPGTTGITLADSAGDKRHSFPRLAAYIADYPEQCLVNAAAGNNSPVTTAMGIDLDSPQRKPFRTKAWILNRIGEACQLVDPQYITEYLVGAKALGLNGVTEPFWRNLPGYQPELCVGPDILHGFHRFWRDHVLKWIIVLLGKPEIDSRLRVLQPVVGLRHFDKGISHLSQWSGREDRELQRTLLAAIDGHAKIDSNVMRALRAIQDFGYLIQYRSQSEETLVYLKRALSLFHSLLTTAFIKDGRRLGAKKPKRNAKKPPPKPHFRIPKLAGLHVYLYHIPEMGSSPQFSTEITETLHQSMAKAAYKATNRRDFVPQMCRFLDRTEKIIHMNAFVDWAILQRQHERHQALIEMFPVGGPARQAILDADLEVPVQKGDKQGRIWHTLTPHYRKVPLRDACRQYNLSHTLLTRCLRDFLDNTPYLDFQDLCVDIWRQFRIKIPTVQEHDELAQARTVQALPPLPTMPYGRCNSVLVHDNEEARTTGIIGYRVAQIKMVFRLLVPRNSPFFMVPLMLVYWFTRPLHQPEKDVKMYQLKRRYTADGRPVASIIEMASIARFVELIPRLGRKVHPDLTKDNAMHKCDLFLLNSFTDKEIYQAVW